MTYFTSWDANVFLCLVTWGLPEDVVKGMLKMTKKVNQEFTLGEALGYWTTNSPKLMVVRSETRLAEHAHIKRVDFKFQISEILEFLQTRQHVFKIRLNLTKEFKNEWRLRSIEERQKKVVDWCKFASEQEQKRHQLRLSKTQGHIEDHRKRVEVASKLDEYVKNLWKPWESWCHCEHYPMIMSWVTKTLKAQYRRNYVSKWYEGIHPGRFFLFYRENEIIQERNRGAPKGPCEDGYQYPKTPIYDRGPYEQLIEDLRCIDGPGIGEKAGSTVEHIDDLFSK